MRLSICYFTAFLFTFLIINTQLGAQIMVMDGAWLRPYKTRIVPPQVALKTNLVYDATTTMNLGLEIGLGFRTTLDISGNYNPWNLKDGRKFRHWLIQPEFRYWLCERFNRHFFGVHVHYAEFNVAKIHLLGTQDARHQGNLYGIGVSYGYQWLLARHWNLEATVGVGYARLKYDRYQCKGCERYIDTRHKNYFGPTKVGISLIFLIK